ncbi:hypothetical protein B484DRAFT_440814, partial [Ochromonadaceae sp. CCMP2298]
MPMLLLCPISCWMNIFFLGLAQADAADPVEPPDPGELEITLPRFKPGRTGSCLQIHPPHPQHPLPQRHSYSNNNSNSSDSNSFLRINISMSSIGNSSNSNSSSKMTGLDGMFGLLFANFEDGEARLRALLEQRHTRRPTERQSHFCSSRRLHSRRLPNELGCMQMTWG